MDTQSRKEGAVAVVAGRQRGRITRAQLNRIRVTNDAVRRWTENGYLTRVLPKVYAVGHAAPSREANLWAAVLYAGPGAMLCHATNSHWRGLIDYAPRSIQVSSPRDVRSLPGIKVYGRRTGLVRELHKGIPVTTIPVMMVDLAATSSSRVVQRALGQLAHWSAAQRRRDRANDLTLRGHGLTVLRYDWNLVHERPAEVCADVLRELERLVQLRRARPPARGPAR